MTRVRNSELSDSPPTCANASGREALQTAHYELEQRVEERTTELKAARERMRYLMTVAPGIMYTNQASGKFTCTFVSDNVDPIMGFSPWEMLEDPKFWPSRLHPEDAPQVFAEVGRLITAGGGAVEYRFRHRDGNYLRIQDTFKVIPDEVGKPLEVVGLGEYLGPETGRARLGRAPCHYERPAGPHCCQPVGHLHHAGFGDFACTFVSDNLKSTMGYATWETRDDPEILGQAYPSGRCSTGICRTRSAHRPGWRDSRVPVPASERPFYLDPGHFHRHPRQRRQAKGTHRYSADISDRKRANCRVGASCQEVELRNRFIRETFGRYLTDDVVATVLELPTGLQVGGEKRKVTMMMTDLRGFTSLSERLSPERVVALLNRYLAAMVTIIKRYQGTIDEFIGDAIFVLFGAPVWQEDDAQRAVACALAMQLAMEDVNEANRKEDLPEVEMGIGIHTGQVVLGNIGSPERMKYGVVGRHVNLTSRIQSYTTGGQILISEATRRQAGTALKLGIQTAIKAKGN